MTEELSVSFEDEIKYKNNLKQCCDDEWILWCHLPHDTNWTLESYIKIAEIKTVGDIIYMLEKTKEMTLHSMLFFMKKGITPMWEDPSNKTGGSFSYKLDFSNVLVFWEQLAYMILGNTLFEDENYMKNVNGFTISPKKNFYIIKVWMKNSEYNDTSKIIGMNDCKNHGCIFKKHIEE